MTRRNAKAARCRTFQPEVLENRGLLSTLAIHPAVPAEVQSAPGRVTLQGEISGTASLAGVDRKTGLPLVMTSGTGNLSHLGKSTIQGGHEVIFLYDGTTDIVDGVVTITAANGDQLVLDYTGTGVPNGFGGFHDSYSFTVDGTHSTGRFAPTGGGDIHADDSPGGPP